MRLLESTLDQTLQHAPADALGQLSQLIDNDWIAQVLHLSGKASIRRRSLRTGNRWVTAPRSTARCLGPRCVRCACWTPTPRGLLDARLGSVQEGELTLASDLQGIDQSLTVFDCA